MMIKTIENCKVHFTGDVFVDEDEFVEVDETVEDLEKLICENVDLLAVIFLQRTLTQPRQLCLIAVAHLLEGRLINQFVGEAQSISQAVHRLRDMPQHLSNVCLRDSVLILEVKTLVGHEHLLLLGSHKHREEEFHELIMVNPLISVGIYDGDYSLTQQFGKIQVLLCRFFTQIVFVIASNQAVKDLAQVGHENGLHKMALE